MRFLIGSATSAEIAAHPNRLSGGLAIQGATADTVTLGLQDRHEFPAYVGATIEVDGYGTRTIVEYADLVATLDAPWGTIPPPDSSYRILSQHIPPGASWYGEITPWSSPYQNCSGFKIALMYDRSDAQDQSDMVTVISASPSQALGMNGCDGEVYVYANILALISRNTLQGPPKTCDWNPGVPGSPRGVVSSPLDVGPQLILFRDHPNPSNWSAHGSIQWDGRDANGVHINLGYMQAQAIPPGGNPVGGHQLFTKFSSMSYGFILGGNNGGGAHFEDNYLHDAGAGTLHTKGMGVNHQWLNVP